MVHTTLARGRPGVVRLTEKVTMEPWLAVREELPTAVSTGGTGEEGSQSKLGLEGNIQNLSCSCTSCRVLVIQVYRVL